MENQDNLGFDPGQQVPLVVSPEDLDDDDQPDDLAQQPAPIVVTDDDLDREAGVIQTRAGATRAQHAAAPVYSWTDAYTNSLADRLNRLSAAELLRLAPMLKKSPVSCSGVDTACKVSDRANGPQSKLSCFLEPGSAIPRP
jgi:hypothetical protein